MAKKEGPHQWAIDSWPLMLTDNMVIIDGSWKSDAFNVAVRFSDSARSFVAAIANMKALSGKLKRVARHAAIRLRCGLAKRSGSVHVLLPVAGSRVPRSATPTGAVGSQSLRERTPRTTDGERQCSSEMVTSVLPANQPRNSKRTTSSRGHGSRRFVMPSRTDRRCAESATKNTADQSLTFGLLSSNTVSISVGSTKPTVRTAIHSTASPRTGRPAIGTAKHAIA